MENFHNRALLLLEKWCDAIIEHQIDMPGIKSAHGGLYCPACAYVHGRIADAVYPMVYMYKASSDEKYIDCAKKLIEWCENNVLINGGMYANDKNKTWWLSTTAFCQTAIGNTLLKLSDCLDSDFKNKLSDIFERQTREIYIYFSDPEFKSAINYPMQFCFCMALAYKIIGDEKYKKAAYDKYRELDKTCFTKDGLIIGEGKTLDPTENGSYCIDIGYNLEESMCALTGFAEIFEDKQITSELSKRMKAHLEYMLPDGALDNSWGSRSYKWTYYGSRTSDGCQGGLLSLAKLTGDNIFVKAAIKNFELYERCTTKEGLLAGGLMYEDAEEDTCIHHTFCHAKALTELCEYLEENDVSVENVALPRENEYGTKFIQGANTALVSYGKWRSTVSVNDYRGYGYANGGGSITLLWNEDIGAVLAANMSKYISVEPKNMQYQMKSSAEICMTPRIIFYDKDKHNILYSDGIYSSDNGLNSKISIGENNLKEPEITVEGILCQANGNALENGGYSLTYSYDKKGNSVSIKVSSKVGGVYSIPVIASHRDTVKLHGKNLSIARNGRTIEVSSSKDIVIGHRDKGSAVKYIFDRIYRGENENTRAFSTVGGFMYVPLEITLDKNKALYIRLTIK